jgi:hypothetical protein
MGALVPATRGVTGSGIVSVGVTGVRGTGPGSGVRGVSPHRHEPARMSANETGIEQRRCALRDRGRRPDTRSAIGTDRVADQVVLDCIGDADA